MALVYYNVTRLSYLLRYSAAIDSTILNYYSYRK